MFKKILSVIPLDDYFLNISFDNGEKIIYDVKPMIEKHDEFKALVNISGLFEQVKIDQGGYGISWNDDIDLEFN
jgi:hypothetical protein